MVSFRSRKASGNYSERLYIARQTRKYNTEEDYKYHLKQSKLGVEYSEQQLKKLENRLRRFYYYDDSRLQKLQEDAQK